MESQSMVFLLAGFETTSTSLALLSYQLALNPDVQEKLRNEVDEHFPDVNQVTQLNSTKNKWLNLGYVEDGAPKTLVFDNSVVRGGGWRASFEILVPVEKKRKMNFLVFVLVSTRLCVHSETGLHGYGIERGTQISHSCFKVSKTKNIHENSAHQEVSIC